MTKVTPHQQLRDQAIEWIVQLRNPCVSKAKQRAFADWLAQSEQHKNAFDRQLNEFQLLEALPTPSLKDQTRNREGLAIGDCFRTPVLAFMFTLVCALVLIFSQPMEPQTQHYSTQVGEIRTETLADGSRITLNTHSHLEVSYTEQKRWLKLHKGEAYFDVAHNPNQPFEVYSNDFRVVALGTAFNINNTMSQSQIAVTEGSIRFDVISEKQFETEYFLKEGEQLKLSEHARKKSEIKQPHHVASWRQGYISFDKTQLIDAITELNRYLDKPGKLAHQGLYYRKISGDFSLKNPHSALQAIALSENLDLQSQRSSWLLSDVSSH